MDIKFEGYQYGARGELIGPCYTDLKTGSTFLVRTGDSVQTQLDKLRRAFKNDLDTPLKGKDK